MNSEKQVRYEISSDDEDESDHQHNQELAQDQDSTIIIGGGTIKRSYDCTFCKRGFTNAQALGGHMNIHRKDRAKSKQVITPNNYSSSSSLLQNTTIEEEFMVLPNFSSEFSHQFPTRNYSILESQRNNCDMSSYFHPPQASSNTYLGNQHASPYHPLYAHHGFQHEAHNNLRSQPVNFNDEFGGANLSLQIGPSHVDNANQSTKGSQKDGEVDLELRLGHDPC